MNAKEKAIYQLNEIKAIEKFTLDFTLADYANPQNAQHILLAVSKIMEFMFKEKYGNVDDAAANSLDLVFVKQLTNINLPPVKLMEFVKIIMPKTKADLEAEIFKMESGGKERIDDKQERKRPFNPLVN
jgi:hypothetical protein